MKAFKSKKFQLKHANIKSASGEMLHRSDVLSRLREYGENLYKKSTDEVPLMLVLVAEKEPALLMEEIVVAINQLKNGKVPGADWVPTELIKHTGTAGIKVIHRLIYNTRSGKHTSGLKTGKS